MKIRQVKVVISITIFVMILSFGSFSVLSNTIDLNQPHSVLSDGIEENSFLSDNAVRDSSNTYSYLGVDVLILYSGNDPIIDRSMGLFYNTINGLIDISSLEVSSVNQLEQSLLSVEKSTIVTYFFHGTSEGLHVTENEVISWQDLESVIFRSRGVFHYFASCDSSTIDYASEEKVIVGNEGKVDYKIASLVVSMATGTTLEPIDAQVSQAILNRAVNIVEADKDDFLERILNPIETMDALHFKSDALRTVEDLFQQIEDFFKDATKNPSIAFLESLFELVVGPIDIQTPLRAYGGIGGKVKVNDDLSISYWVGREVQVYRASDHAEVDYDIYIDVVAIKIGVEYEKDKEIVVGGVPVTVTFGVEGELVLEFLLEYYGSNPSNLASLVGIYPAGTVSDPEELMAYAITDGMYDGDKVIEAPFGSSALGIPVTFRVYGQIQAFVKGNLGINLKEKWDKLPNITIPVEVGGKLDALFSLGGPGLGVDLDAMVYAFAGWDNWEKDIKIGKISADLWIKFEIPLRAMLMWDTLGSGYDSLYVYYPRISGEASATFTSSKWPIPSFGKTIWDKYNGAGENFYYLGQDLSGDKTSDSSHPANIWVSDTNPKRFGPGIDKMLTINLPTALNNILNGKGEQILGTAFDRTPPSLQILTSPTNVNCYSDSSYSSWWGGRVFSFPNFNDDTWHLYSYSYYNVFSGWRTCDVSINPIRGDDATISFETTDPHDTYNFDSKVQYVAVGIDEKPNNEMHRDSLIRTYTNYYDGRTIDLPASTGARKVRYLLELHFDDVRSNLVIKGSDSETYGLVTPTNLAYPNFQPQKQERIYNELLSFFNSYHSFVGWEYDFFAGSGFYYNIFISLFNALPFSFDLEAYRDISIDVVNDRVYVWTPWIEGSYGKITASLRGNDWFEVKSVEYSESINWTNEQTSSSVSGFIKKDSEIVGSATLDYSATWTTYMDLYRAKHLSGLANGWHTIYFVAMDTAGLETVETRRYYIDNPVDTLAPEIDTDHNLKVYLPNSTPNPDQFVSGLSTLVFKARDPSQTITYTDLEYSGGSNTYDIASGIDMTSGFKFELFTEDGVSINNETGTYTGTVSGWEEFYIRYDFASLTEGAYMATVNVIDNVGLITYETFWIYVKEPTNILFDDQGGSTSGWNLRTVSRNQLVATSSTIYIKETSSGYSTPLQGYTYTILDLSSWSGGDLHLDFKIRATSNWYSSSVTNFLVGLTTDPTVGFNVFSHFEYRLSNFDNDPFVSGTDSGWKTRSITVSRDTMLNAGLVPGSGSVELMWGFSDAWSSYWNQKVELDFLRVTEDKVLLNDPATLSNGWVLRQTARNEFIATGTTLFVHETASGTSNPSQGLVYKEISLAFWTGGDLKLDFKIRATSSYGSSSVTNYRMGLTTDPLLDNNVFSHSEYRLSNFNNDPFVSGYDSGWKTRSLIIPSSNLINAGLSAGSGTVKLMWGFGDGWYANWDQKVELDYVILANV